MTWMSRTIPDGAEMVELEGNPRPGVIEPDLLYHFYALVLDGKILSIKAKSEPVDLSARSVKLNWGFLKSEAASKRYMDKFCVVYGDPETLLPSTADWSELELQ